MGVSKTGHAGNAIQSSPRRTRCPTPIWPRPSTTPSRSAPTSAPRPKARCARRSRPRSPARSRQGAGRRARRHGAWTVNQWLKKAVLLSFRLNDNGPMAGAAGDRPGGTRCRPSSRAGTASALQGGGLSRRAGRVVRHSAYIAPNVVLMPLVRQSRRLCRCRHHGRHLGHGRLLRPDRQELPSLGRRRHRRRARAAAGRSGDHRGQLLHRRARRSRRRRRGGRRLGAVDGRRISAPRPRSSTARRARCSRARCRPTRSSCPGHCRASRCPTASRGPSLYCAVIVKRVDEKTRAKTSINELLRD